MNKYISNKFFKFIIYSCLGIAISLSGVFGTLHVPQVNAWTGQHRRNHSTSEYVSQNPNPSSLSSTLTILKSQVVELENSIKGNISENQYLKCDSGFSISVVNNQLFQEKKICEKLTDISGKIEGIEREIEELSVVDIDAGDNGENLKVINIVQRLLRISEQRRFFTPQDLNPPIHEIELSLQDITQWSSILTLSKQVSASIDRTQKNLNAAKVEVWAEGYLGRVYEARANLQQGAEHQTNFEEAERHTIKALNLARSLNASYAPNDQAVQNPTLGLEELIFPWEWQLARIAVSRKNASQAKSYYAAAYQTVSRFRRNLLLLDDQKEFEFRDRIEPLYREYIQLLLEANENQDLMPLDITEQLIDRSGTPVDSRQLIAELRLSELENLFRCNLETDNPRNSDIEIIAKRELKQGKHTAVIYPIVLQDRLEVLLKLPDEDFLHQYPSQMLINQDNPNPEYFDNTLKRLRFSLEQPYFSSQWGKETATTVYDWLIRPAEKDGILSPDKIETLVFVLDGEFRDVPMAALYDSQEEKFLIEKYAIALTLGNLQLPKSNPRKKLRILAGGLSLESIANDNEKFGQLKFVNQELTDIENVIHNTDGTVKRLLDSEFTERNLSDAIQDGNYNVIHLATHGAFGSNRKKTYLLTVDQIFGGNEPAKVNKVALDKWDELFRSRDRNPIDLLVLSACETATGDNREVLGIAGATVETGARSTLASLWSISDSSTSVLMKAFYEGLIDENLSKAQALQQAQILLLENPAYPPSDWAPYLLVGDWR